MTRYPNIYNTHLFQEYTIYSMIFFKTVILRKILIISFNKSDIKKQNINVIFDDNLIILNVNRVI